MDPLATAWATIIDVVGRPGDSHTTKSPKRIAAFLRSWMTEGAPEPVVTTFPADGCDELVVERAITFHSLCAHHALPFFGVATIGYLPRKRIAGLSKFARVIDHYAHRLQVQERLTIEIADALEAALKPRGLGVVLRAEHLCMSMRGVSKPGHQTITSVMRGVLRQDRGARAELLSLAT